METQPKKTATVKASRKPPKKVSKTWLAYLEARKTPGKIVDMRAVLK